MCCQSHKSPLVAACQWSISLKCGTGKGLLLVLLVSFPMKTPWSWEENICKGLLTCACLSSGWCFFDKSCHLMWPRLRSSPCQASTHSLPLLLEYRYIPTLTGTPVTCWFTASTPFAFPVIPQVYCSLGQSQFLPWGLVCLIHLLQHKEGGRVLSLHISPQTPLHLSFPSKTIQEQPRYLYETAFQNHQDNFNVCCSLSFPSLLLMPNCLTLLWTAVQACHSRSVFPAPAQSPKHRSRCLRHCLADQSVIPRMQVSHGSACVSLLSAGAGTQQVWWALVSAAPKGDPRLQLPCVGVCISGLVGSTRIQDLQVTTGRCRYSLSSVFFLHILNCGQKDAPVQQSTEAVVWHSKAHACLLSVYSNSIKCFTK